MGDCVADDWVGNGAGVFARSAGPTAGGDPVTPGMLDLARAAARGEATSLHSSWSSKAIFLCESLRG